MHSINLTVRGFHCDLYQHVNNARYLEFLEDARWDWINRTGSMEFFSRLNMSFVVVSVTIHYRHPAILNDVLEITAEPGEINNKSATVKQQVRRKKDGKLIADAVVTFVMIDNETGKPTPITEEMKQYLLL